MTLEVVLLLEELVRLASREMLNVVLSSLSSDTGGDSCDVLLRETIQRPYGVKTFRCLEQMSSALDLLGWSISSLLPSLSLLRGSSDVIESSEVEVEVEGGEMDLCCFIV